MTVGIKTDGVQIGTNTTATQNFVLNQGADGTLTLARGNDGATTQNVLTVDANGLVSLPQGKQLTLATAQATTSGTAIDFTGIPSWVKRITVIFSGLSTSGTSLVQLQLGSGSVTTTGYLSGGSFTQNTSATVGANSTTGLLVHAAVIAAQLSYGNAILTYLSGNTWVCSVLSGQSNSSSSSQCGGSITLAGTLDRIRLTTVNGTDTFDAGSVNIMYEG